MILFLLLLILALAVVGVYAAQNPGTQDITVLNMHFHSVANWLPVVAAAALVALLLVLYMLYAGAVHGARTGSLRRRISTHEGALADLRKENQRLREENARMRSEMRGNERGAVGDGKPVYNQAGQRTYAADESEASEMSGAEGTDRSRAAESYNPRPGVGERVRSFFSGREPSSY